VSPTLGPYGWRIDLVSLLFFCRGLQMRLGDHGCEVTDAAERLKTDGLKSVLYLQSRRSTCFNPSDKRASVEYTTSYGEDLRSYCAKRHRVQAKIEDIPVRAATSSRTSAASAGSALQFQEYMAFESMTRSSGMPGKSHSPWVLEPALCSERSRN
jgi:hypothetical protein